MRDGFGKSGLTERKKGCHSCTIARTADSSENICQRRYVEKMGTGVQTGTDKTDRGALAPLYKDLLDKWSALTRS